MKLTCRVHELIWESDKKYLALDVGSESSTIKQIHTLSSKPVTNLVETLRGDTLRVKVPFRYNRVMCKVTGNVCIQDLVKGDTVSVELKYCGWWVSGDYGGPSWKLVSLEAAPRQA
jgi:hypothetical protein